MKNFKKTVALLVMYVMTILMLPIGTFKAYATENVPQYLTINDMYVRSISQYENKALVSYEKDGNSLLSLFTNGTEKIIKELEKSEDCDQYLSVIDGNNTAYVIESKYYNTSSETNYYSFDFNTEALTEITVNDIVYPSNNNSVDYSYSLVDDESIKNSVVEKINSKFETNYTLKSELNTDGNIEVRVRKLVIDNATPMYEYSAYAYYDNISEEYFGLYGESVDILFEGYHSYNAYLDFTSGTYFVQENPYTANSNLYIVQNSTLIDTCKVNSDFNLYKIRFANGKIVSRNYNSNSYDEYSIINNELVNTNSIAMSNSLISIPYDKDGNMWTYFIEDSKAYVAKVEDGKAIKRYEVPVLEKNELYYDPIQMYVYDENNIVLSGTFNKTVFIQNETIVTPEEPSDDNTTTPDDNNTSDDSTNDSTINDSTNDSTENDSTNNDSTNNDSTNNDSTNDNTDESTDDNNNNSTNNSTDNTVVVTPNENGTSKVEISEVNADSVNNITLNKDTTKFEVSITDIDALKNGTGSIQVTASNNIDINIPFSTIDKSLLEGATAVKLQYTAVENSDITKDIKGLKKVFNFELIVEKESGNVSIHNFANGVAEVKITLTDEDLNGLNKDNLAVFYYNETTKKFEMMETRIEGNDVIFKTPHFSSFVIAEKNTTNDGNTVVETLPQTGAPISSYAIFAFALVLVASGAVLANKRNFTRA